MHVRRLPFFLLAAALAGCSELPKRDPAKTGPFFIPRNTTSTALLPVEIRRVAVLPVWGSREIADASLQRIDEALMAELTRTGRFETTQVSRQAMQDHFGVRSAASTDALPRQLLEKSAAIYAADAVLLTDVTALSPYPPLKLGLRMKLARVSDGVILWSADNVFDAGDPSVANAARRFALNVGTDRGPGDLSHTVLQNPSRFAAYAAAATFETLPVR